MLQGLRHTILQITKDRRLLHTHRASLRFLGMVIIHQHTLRHKTRNLQHIGTHNSNMLNKRRLDQLHTVHTNNLWAVQLMFIPDPCLFLPDNLFTAPQQVLRLIQPTVN